MISGKKWVALIKERRSSVADNNRIPFLYAGNRAVVLHKTIAAIVVFRPRYKWNSICIRVRTFRHVGFDVSFSLVYL